MKTTFLLLLVCGGFSAALAQSAACLVEEMDGPDCGKAPLSRSLDDGTRGCCFKGGMSISTSYFNGAISVTCTCEGAGVQPYPGGAKPPSSKSSPGQDDQEESDPYACYIEPEGGNECDGAAITRSLNDGTQGCCFASGMSLSTSTINGVATITCTCDAPNVKPDPGERQSPFPDQGGDTGDSPAGSDEDGEENQAACLVEEEDDYEHEGCQGAAIIENFDDGTRRCCFNGAMSQGTSTSYDGTKSYICNCRGEDVQNIPGGGKVELTDLEDFRKAALQSTNDYRAKHGAPALVISDDLNRFAQNWAEQMASMENMIHSDRILVHPDGTQETLGENIASASGSGWMDWTGPEPVKLWYDEIKDYNWNYPGFSHLTGHFTQLVWKETTELGMGKARSADGKKVYVSASYRVAGNDVTPGQFTENVRPLV